MTSLKRFSTDASYAFKIGCDNILLTGQNKFLQRFVRTSRKTGF
jgi:hypothetical protein